MDGYQGLLELLTNPVLKSDPMIVTAIHEIGKCRVDLHKAMAKYSWD